MVVDASGRCAKAMRNIGCDHLRMLKSVKVPVLFTHHFRKVDEPGGPSHGAVSDFQAKCAGELIKAAGQPFDYTSFPQIGHAMHRLDPSLYASTLKDWGYRLTLNPAACCGRFSRLII
jgi:hypothetical protein